MAIGRDIHRVLLGIEKKFADLRGRGVYSGFPDRYRCIFIHIPKTAGSAVAQSLFDAPSRHDPYWVYKTVNASKFGAYFKFAFVRNPWDRLVSSYEYLSAGGNDLQDRVWAARHMPRYPDFGSFVRKGLTEPGIRSWMHFVPQTDFILDRTGRLMVDFLGRFENLEEDFRAVASRLNSGARLETANASQRRPFQSYYDQDTARIVRNVYARDIEVLGYQESLPTVS